MSSDRSLASKDVKVTLTLSPDTGYYASSVTYKGDTMNAEVISANGVYSFNMPSEDITVSAVFSEIIYPVSYDLHGGSVSGNNPLIYTITYTLNNASNPGNPASITVTATQGVGLAWSMSGTLPAGMSFSSSDKSATISGTPQLGTTGTYSAIITATNTKGSASATVAITVANDFAESGDTETGAATTVTTSAGTSNTTKATAFKNGTGRLILSADIAITAEDEYIIAIAGEDFITELSVDVAIL